MSSVRRRECQSKRKRMQIRRLIDAEWQQGFCTEKKWVETTTVEITSFSRCKKPFLMPGRLYDFAIILQSIVINGRK